MTKHKHLTLSDRNDIQLGLERSETFKAIGQSILKDPTTVSKEVKRNRQVRESTCHNLPCPLLDKAPFVCNGCPKRRQNCGYKKIFYLAKQAQKQYEQTLGEAREGTPLNSKTFWDMDKVISDGVKKGQHIYHILKTHNLDVSSSTVYRHIRKGYLSIAPIDLARAVKFKERRKSKLPSIPKEAKKGRSYEDFQNYLALNQLDSWLEMDTVMGRMGGKVLLTFNLSFCNFIFARLLDNKTALEVTKHLYDIKNTLHQADKDFFQLFPVILTDNGGEFARVDDIEMDVRGESKLFFCDPNRSDQKGRIEKNHTLIRDILPKGTSFDNLTQEDINLVCSHVNSVKRAALNGKSAYELFAFTYGEEIPKLLGISKIPAEDVCQSSKLLQHKF
ncbi:MULTISPECIES: IS30 family transposase [Streptococcus]|uniref:IS30 family transposase n=11 Tax=Streptococcus TaxID=1301 RepID=A0ABM8CJ35_9STRE|nr:MULTISPECIES: IS30 family transposase [Streptococcus]MDS5648634.1 IS30 family transposase [Streptococcus pneumoniae]BDT65494.1 IS30 family transposase [Streptococcus sp. SP4011]AEL10979.1 transposase, ISSmi3 [Streptococcus pseudopneumoniae IS7493]MDS5689337.1 IS30 family transposase [Streptococcus pneumoniae]NIB86733.1 IS30 family transposase [Streptococcus pseudopneumoniae]